MGSLIQEITYKPNEKSSVNDLAAIGHFYMILLDTAKKIYLILKLSHYQMAELGEKGSSTVVPPLITTPPLTNNFLVIRQVQVSFGEREIISMVVAAIIRVFP